MLYTRIFLDAVSGLVWQDGESSSILKDDYRGYGYTVRERYWRAYDGSAARTNGAEMKYLGRFTTREQAKQAIETAAGVHNKPLVMSAGSRSIA